MPMHAGKTASDPDTAPDLLRNGALTSGSSVEPVVSTLPIAGEDAPEKCTCLTCNGEITKSDSESRTSGDIASAADSECSITGLVKTSARIIEREEIVRGIRQLLYETERPTN
jgi:hypothetical protein